jgi:hypothetical protein
MNHWAGNVEKRMLYYTVMIYVLFLDRRVHASCLDDFPL